MNTMLAKVIIQFIYLKLGKNRVSSRNYELVITGNYGS